MGEDRLPLENRILTQIPKNTVGRYDLIPIFTNQSLLTDIASYLAAPYRGHVDMVAAPEALGWILAVAIAKELEVGFLPIRKQGKLPYHQDQLVSQSYTDYSGDTKVLQVAANGRYKELRFLICDEWIETGSTMQCCMDIISMLGGITIGMAAIGVDSNAKTNTWIEQGLLHNIGKDM